MKQQTNNNKMVVKNTLMLYVRMLLLLFIGLFTSREILRILGVTDYGIYNVVGGVVAMLSFLSGSLSSSTSRFLTFEIGKKDLKKLKDTFSSSLLVHFILAILIVVILETGGLWFLNSKLNIPVSQLDAAKIVFQISIATSFIQIIAIPFSAVIIAHEKMGIYAYIGILDAIFKLLVVYVLLVVDNNKLITYAILLFIASLISPIINVTYCLKNFDECKTSLRFIKSICFKMLSYASWDLYGNFSITIRGQGVNILLNIFFGPVVNAASGVANQVMNIIMGFSNNFLTAVNPQIVKSYSSEEFTRFNSLIINTSKFCFLLLFLISFPILLEANFILHIWLTDVPEYSSVFCQLIIINNWITMIFRPLVIGVSATGKIRRVSFINGTVYLLVLPTSYIFLKHGGSPTIPFILNIILLIIGHLFTLQTIGILISQFSCIKFIKKAIIPAFLIASISSLIPFIIYNLMESGWPRFIIVTTTSILIIGMMSYKFGINNSIRNKINNKLQKIIQFI